MKLKFSVRVGGMRLGPEVVMVIRRVHVPDAVNAKLPLTMVSVTPDPTGRALGSTPSTLSSAQLPTTEGDAAAVESALLPPQANEPIRTTARSVRT